MGTPDKNLENTVKDLEETPVNALEAQQQQQAHNDDRKAMIDNDRGDKPNEKKGYQ
ncbi:hypothetical protein [Paenibacillus swuensis]|uniref:hypothetical protein n=1 Tax=Paenibacillus swuensis TaxID=1178515 RepID=UPI0018D4BE9D|nr:hypothetical protein [Paenibacillus swuensis]